MKVKQKDLNVPYQTIENAALITGLSQYSLRLGCKCGAVPHIRQGSKYLINVDLLRQQLDRESMQNAGAVK